MDRYLTLLGAEQVQSAARSMQSAADRMYQAASLIDDCLRRHERAMEEFATRIEKAFEAADNP